jgi:hypothetical protein
VRQRIRLILVFLVFLGLGAFLWLLIIDREQSFQKENTKREIAELSQRVFDEAYCNEIPLVIRANNAKELYSWLCEPKRLRRADSPWAIWRDRGYPALLDREGRTFRDPWGQELLFRFPSNHVRLLFDLYSIGPNGIDEEGAGDDICCDVDADLEAQVAIFHDRLVDPVWVKANLGRLERDSGGRIWGVER